MVNAQTSIESTIDVTSQTKLSLNAQYADIEVTSWDGDQIIIEGTVDIDDGKLDEYFNMDVNDKRDVIYVESSVDEKAFKGNSFMIFKKQEQISADKCKSKYTSYCKSRANCISNCRSNRKGDKSNIDRVSYNVDIILNIKVPKNMILDISAEYGEVELNNPTQEVIVRNTFGGVKAIIPSSRLNDIELESKFKFVDLTISEDAQYDLSLYTEFGSLYTDFDNEVSNGMTTSIEEAFKQDIRSTINGGGTKVKLSSNFGNVYLRKYSK